jgi:hypothetical protein
MRCRYVGDLGVRLVPEVRRACQPAQLVLTESGEVVER